ncbi:hypothetical protein HU200_020784 [Digitaria exilis]|jgi:hypothetical protein
MLLM